jgi:aldose sugar dehydrogenase
MTLNRWNGFLWVGLVTACGVGQQTDNPVLERGAMAAAAPIPVDPPAAIPSLSPPETALMPSPVPGAAPPSNGLVPPAGLAASQRTDQARTLMPDLLRQTVAKGLHEPTDLAVLPNGTVFAVERERGLAVFSPLQGIWRVFAPADLAHAGGGGMLGLAVDPLFDRTKQVYVFMTSSLGGDGASNRVVRLTLDADAKHVIRREDIVTGIRFVNPSGSPGMLGTRHFGGRLAIGPSGHLYVGTGDGFGAEAPQSLQVLAGKVLQIDVRALVAPNQTSMPDVRLRAIGIRDPVGIGFHPNSEALVVADRGGSSVDEVFLVPAGGNAGWDPRCTDAAQKYCGDASAGSKEVPMNKLSSPQTVTHPAWQSSSRGNGLSAMAPLRGTAWRDWNSSFALAFDAGQRIDLVKIDTSGQVVQQATLLRGLGYGFAAISQGPDGLYVATRGKPGGEEIVRLVIQW